MWSPIGQQLLDWIRQEAVLPRLKCTYAGKTWQMCIFVLYQAPLQAGDNSREVGVHKGFTVASVYQQCCT